MSDSFAVAWLSSLRTHFCSPALCGTFLLSRTSRHIDLFAARMSILLALDPMRN